MAAIKLPRGLIVDLITPLLKDGAIDVEGLKRHLERIMPHVQAILISGPNMGEGAGLSLEQREGLLVQALNIVQSRIPLLVWISQDTGEKTEETLLRLSKKVSDIKYTGDVFWVDTPLYYHSNRGLDESYKRLSSLVEEPFILINDPEFVGELDQPLKRVNIRTSILKQLAVGQRIMGLIFSGSLDRSYNYRKAVRSQADFMIYDGDESRFFEHPGLNGVLSRGANLAPAAWGKLAASSLSLSGSIEDYPDRLRQIWGIGQFLNDMKNIYKGQGAYFFKQVLAEVGVIECAESSDEEAKDDVRSMVEFLKKYRNYTQFNIRP
jgi:dihydrodipicolinate synthase/N-acetylneuraminate lyase